ncbi:MAG TPA: hypothetical protein VHH09_03130 [Acidimicrobiales bacterium]|nr:hypothetical protein [Acidimicrobiales bacterium]
MIDLDRLEQRLELSLTEDLRVYRSGRAPARAPVTDARAEPVADTRPEPRRERRPEPWPEPRRPLPSEVRAEPWLTPTDDPPREGRRERRRQRRAEAAEEPQLDPGFVVIRPQPRPEPRPEPGWEPPPQPPRAVPTTPAAAPRLGLPPRPEQRTDVVADRDLDLGGHARQVAELLAGGDRRGADYHLAAHARLAEERGLATDRRDAAAMSAMVALLDGRQAEARSASDAVLALTPETGDRQGTDVYWAQRLWIVLEWGAEDEHGELLDYCRERAYRDDDPAWMGTISLLLARAGRVDEARAAFDAASRALDTGPGSAAWLDLATDLAETAALLADAGRAATVTRALARTAVPPVTMGRGWVCKGATARYRGLLAAALARWDEADRAYREAVAVQRSIGAGPLLARTLLEWGRALQGRNEPRSRAYLQEGAELGRRLALADFLRSRERAS